MSDKHPLYGEYTVEGYGERKDYDAPYHPSADFDPQFVHAFAGNTEKQEQYQNDLKTLDSTNEKPAKKAAAKKATAKKATAKKAASSKDK